MPDLEKVLLGLKHHCETGCFENDDDPGCPYWEDTYCGTHLAADALALLENARGSGGETECKSTDCSG